jgi:predicted DCC family thiol-disulfide oxidoreductase YuxK
MPLARVSCEMNAKSQIQVYYDGECPLCRWFRAKVEPLDTGGRLQWINFRETEVTGNGAPTFEQLDAEMFVRTPDMRWQGGFEAWAEIVKVLPGLGWFGKLMTLWPLSWIGPYFYRWIAARRFWLFGIPPPCGQSGVCQVSGEDAQRKSNV